MLKISIHVIHICCKWISSLPADPTGRLDDITPLIQALLNSQFLALHRYLAQRLAGIDFFLTISRVSANYTPGQSHALQTETIIRINIQRTRVMNRMAPTPSSLTPHTLHKPNMPWDFKVRDSVCSSSTRDT